MNTNESFPVKELSVEQARRFWIYLCEKKRWKETRSPGVYSDANRHDSERLWGIQREFYRINTREDIEFGGFDTYEEITSGLDQAQATELMEFIEANYRRAKKAYDAGPSGGNYYTTEDWEQVGDEVTLYQDAKEKLERIMYNLPHTGREGKAFPGDDL